MEKQDKLYGPKTGNDDNAWLQTAKSFSFSIFFLWEKWHNRFEKKKRMVGFVLIEGKGREGTF